MSAQKIFEERLRIKRKAGLVDMKFYIKDGDSLNKEEFYAAINELDDAVDRGDMIQRTTFPEEVEQQSSFLNQ